MFSGNKSWLSGLSLNSLPKPFTDEHRAWLEANMEFDSAQQAIAIMLQADYDYDLNALQALTWDEVDFSKGTVRDTTLAPLVMGFFVMWKRELIQHEQASNLKPQPHVFVGPGPQPNTFRASRPTPTSPYMLDEALIADLYESTRAVWSACDTALRWGKRAADNQAQQRQRTAEAQAKLESARRRERQREGQEAKAKADAEAAQEARTRAEKREADRADRAARRAEQEQRESVGPQSPQSLAALLLTCSCCFRQKPVEKFADFDDVYPLCKACLNQPRLDSSENIEDINAALMEAGMRPAWWLKKRRPGLLPSFYSTAPRAAA